MTTDEACAILTSLRDALADRTTFAWCVAHSESELREAWATSSAHAHMLELVRETRPDKIGVLMSSDHPYLVHEGHRYPCATCAWHIRELVPTLSLAELLRRDC